MRVGWSFNPCFVRFACSAWAWCACVQVGVNFFYTCDVLATRRTVNSARSPPLQKKKANKQKSKKKTWHRKAKGERQKAKGAYASIRSVCLLFNLDLFKLMFSCPCQKYFSVNPCAQYHIRFAHKEQKSNYHFEKHSILYSKHSEVFKKPAILIHHGDMSLLSQLNLPCWWLLENELHAF